MLFNSFEFIFGLLPVSVAGYFLAARVSGRLAVWWLVAVSVFFYGWWRLSDLPVFFGSVAFNFLVGRQLHRAVGGARRGWLIAGLAGDLLLLGVFKYGGFAAANLRALTGWPHALPSLPLPLGISFFTFTQITFLVDTWRRGSERPPLPNYTLFVSFFPHLLAGPILHHGDMLPQFADPANRRVRAGHLWRGLALFSTGLAKKVLLADALAPYAHAGFDQLAAPGLLDAWLAALAYTFQIYFDFSGYTDMAIGVALLFNIRLPFNFNSPYRACDIQAFWRRWHITLGAFFRDYLYIPLGGSRRGRGRTAVNLCLVALCSGLWHGAAWSFVCWGGLHGAAMVAHYCWKALGGRMPSAAGWVLMLLFLVVSWVPFRAPDWPHTRAMLAGLSGRNGIVLPAVLKPTGKPASRLSKQLGVHFGPLATNNIPALLGYLSLAALIAWWPHNSNRLLLEANPVACWQLAALALLAAVSILNLHRLSEFIYFNF